MNKSRFESFSDGVFAFALTLLVLSFVLPVYHRGEGPVDAFLSRSLLMMWPLLVAYLLSFAVIGIMWQNHHALFRPVEKVDRLTVFLNLGLLGCTVFIPFASDMLGRYPDSHTATFLYGIVLTLCATFYNLMLNHLVSRGRFAASFGDHQIAGTVRAYRVGWVTYVVAMLVALASPIVSFALYIIIVGYYLIPHGLEADV